MRQHCRQIKCNSHPSQHKPSPPQWWRQITRFLNTITPPSGMRAERASPALFVDGYKNLGNRILALNAQIVALQKK